MIRFIGFKYNQIVIEFIKSIVRKNNENIYLMGLISKIYYQNLIKCMNEINNAIQKAIMQYCVSLKKICLIKERLFWFTIVWFTESKTVCFQKGLLKSIHCIKNDLFNKETLILIYKCMIHRKQCVYVWFACLCNNIARPADRGNLSTAYLSDTNLLGIARLRVFQQIYCQNREQKR